MFRRIPWLNTATNFVLLRSLSCAVLLLTAAVVWIRIDTHIPENQPAVYLEMGTQAHLNIPPICWFCAFGLKAYTSQYTEKIVFYINSIEWKWANKLASINFHKKTTCLLNVESDPFKEIVKFTSFNGEWVVNKASWRTPFLKNSWFRPHFNAPNQSLAQMPNISICQAYFFNF